VKDVEGDALVGSKIASPERLWPRARPLKDGDPTLGLNDLFARISRSLRSGKQSVAQFFTRDLVCVAREKAAEVETPIAMAYVESLEDKNAKAFVAISDKEAVSSLVLKNKLPLVITFSRETAPSIFESEINKRFLLFAGMEEYEKIRLVYEETAKSFKGQIIFVLVDLANREVAAPVLEFFSLTGDKTTEVVFEQLQAFVDEIFDWSKAVIAYEPV
jgi:hypothetical protein